MWAQQSGHASGEGGGAGRSGHPQRLRGGGVSGAPAGSGEVGTGGRRAGQSWAGMAEFRMPTCRETCGSAWSSWTHPWTSSTGRCWTRT